MQGNKYNFHTILGIQHVGISLQYLLYHVFGSGWVDLVFYTQGYGLFLLWVEANCDYMLFGRETYYDGRLFCWSRHNSIIYANFTIYRFQSEKVHEAIYQHDWVRGSPKYKRLVIMSMLRTMYPCALNVAGIAHINLIALKEVITIS